MVFHDRASAPETTQTHFASAERTSHEELVLEAEACLGHPVSRFLMQALDGLVLILDANRQIIATNDRAIQVAAIGETTPLGHRPGEFFGCVHVPDGPGGCGTSQACTHCGAVLAVLEAQRTDRIVQGECLLTLQQGGNTVSGEFEIVASPLQVGHHRFIAVVLHDLSAVKRRDALERLFYHDIANLMQGIRGWAELLASGTGSGEKAALKLIKLTDLLDRELKGHRAMAQAENGLLEPRLCDVPPRMILEDVEDLLGRHSLARQRKVDILRSMEAPFRTDPELLSRVVLNMAVNAMEATAEGDTITLWSSREGEDVCFRVHNPGEIPAAVRSRIFQRSFTTKGAAGRGLGTYAMKLFGEKVLGGKVGFDTDAAGTTFWVRLPLGH